MATKDYAAARKWQDALRKKPTFAAPAQAYMDSLRSRTAPWAPFQPAAPSPGSYDPALDSALASSQRGFGDLQADTAKLDQRGQVDYGLSRENTLRTRDRGYADIDRNVGLLTKRYESLGRNQLQAGNKAGVISGSSILQAAAAKRAGNMAEDRQPLDTSRTRLGEDTDTALGSLKLNYDRSVEDRGTALTRAQRELGQFGVDTMASRQFQANQGGFDPMAGLPANEHTATKAGRGLKAGETYRVMTIGGVKWRVTPDGRKVSRV